MSSRNELNDKYDLLDKLCQEIQFPLHSDIHTLHNILQNKDSIQSNIQNRENYTKDLITEYTKKVKTLQEQVSDPTSHKIDSQRNTIQRELDFIQSTINNLQIQAETVEKDIEQMKTMQERLETERIVIFEKGDQEQAGYSQEIAITETKLKLLQVFCPIVFDLDTEEHEVRGTVHMVTRGEVKPFTFSAREMPHAEITEKLWQQMWEEQVDKRNSIGKGIM